MTQTDTSRRRLAVETAAKWTNEHVEQLAPLIESALTTLATQIREEDAPYMGHLDDCGLLDTWGKQAECTCGYAAIRARQEKP